MKKLCIAKNVLCKKHFTEQFENNGIKKDTAFYTCK